MAAFISETCVNILFSLYSIPTAQPDSNFIDILLPIHKDIWKTQLNSDKMKSGKNLNVVSNDYLQKIYIHTVLLKFSERKYNLNWKKSHMKKSHVSCYDTDVLRGKSQK